MPLFVVDVIPQADSGETAQNSEPSVGVNPVNPLQMVSGTFGSGTNPYFVSTDGGETWSSFGGLINNHKTIFWAVDGSEVLTTTLFHGTQLNTYSATLADGSFGSPINHFVGSDKNDQPWLATGPNDHVYVAYNDLGASDGKTASVNVSTDGGVTFPQVITLDRVGGAAGQDDPAVRIAASGSTVYAIFDRWNTTLQSDANGSRYDSQLVVVKSVDGGADGFTALGADGNGIQAATNIAVFSDAYNTPLTLGQERIAGGDLAIAIDPNNVNHVVVAYTDSTASGKIQLAVTESFDGGDSWSQKFTTDSAVRAGQPGLAILTDGTIGLLYNTYTPGGANPDADGILSQHLLTTKTGFITTSDTLLGTETNTTPVADFQPYQGDFFNLTAVGDTFYGIFSASNGDNGADASFPNITFQRDFTGTPGTASFQLIDSNGDPVATSIDPFFFAFEAPVPCYCRGTLILTDRGEAAVETLAIGDKVVTADGVARPIRWIGRRSYSGRFARGTHVLPVCIKARALDDQLPRRDLWVSPNHGMLLEGVLIEAVDLINGTSIIQAESADRVDYFHLELDAHDIIVAEGARAESFVDDDSRGMFQNAHEFRALYPDEPKRAARYCAPRRVFGTEVETARRRIALRAGVPYARPRAATVVFQSPITTAAPTRSSTTREL